MSSFPCPECGADTGVTDSRPVNKPFLTVRRRRKCVSCGHRCSTHEVIAEVHVRQLVDLTDLPIGPRKAVRALVRALLGDRA